MELLMLSVLLACGLSKSDRQTYPTAVYRVNHQTASNNVGNTAHEQIAKIGLLRTTGVFFQH